MQKIAYREMYTHELTHGWYLGTREALVLCLNQQLKKTAKILDAGCGTGGTSMFLKKKRYTNVFGIEISPEALAYCKKRGIKNINLGSITKLPYLKESFDAVICMDVLYHQRVNPILAITEFNRVLKKGGLLYIQEPAYNWLKSNHDIYIETAQRFTRKQLSNLLQQHNFAIMMCTYFNTLLFPLQVVKRIKDKFFSYPHTDVQPLHPLVNWLLLTTLRLEARLIAFINLPFGLSLICVGKKKV